MKQDNNAAPMKQPGTITPVPQAGSYTTPKPAGDVANAAKVANGGGKPGTSLNGPTENMGKMGDHVCDC